MENTSKVQALRKQLKQISKKFWIISNIFIVPISFFVGGILGQMIRGYGRFVGDGMARKFVYTANDLFHFYLENPLVGIVAFAASILFLNIFAFYIKCSVVRGGLQDEDRNFTYSEKDTYGTSRWMNKEETEENFEILKSIDTTDNLLVGQDTSTGDYLTLPDDAPLNNLHRTIIGGSGAGKSASVLQNDIFQFAKKEESMVITDPSGELFSRNASWLRKRGYNVKVFNLVDLENSDSWNCLGELEGGEKDIVTNAQIFADVIISNTSGKEGNDFWAKCAMNLLKAVCLYVLCSPIIPHNLGEAYKILTSRSMVEMDQLFDTLPYNKDTEVAHMAYQAYKNASDTVRGNVLIDLGSRLQVFQAPVVRDITSHNEINLQELGERKSAYFVITSDQHSAFDFLAVLFYTMLFIKLVERAQKEKSLDPKKNMKLPVHVNFLLDEFANIGAIPDFKKKISTVRKYGMNISIVIQSLAQLQDRYPGKQWEEILSNCCVLIYLAGGTDQTTAKYISDLTGTATVQVESQNKDRNLGAVIPPLNYKESTGLGKRAILNPDEVMQLNKQELLVFLQGQKPKKAKKIWYYKRPEYKELEIENPSEYMPEWKKNEENEKFVSLADQKAEELKGSSQEEYQKEKKPALRQLVEERARQNNGRPAGFK